MQVPFFLQIFTSLSLKSSKVVYTLEIMTLYITDSVTMATASNYACVVCAKVAKIYYNRQKMSGYRT